MFKSSLLVLLILFAVSNLYSQELSLSETAYIDSVMNSVYKTNEPGAVILAAINGKAVFRKAYGMASLELGVTMKPEYVFPLGSIIKQFTAVSILQLAESGKIFLQDDIRKYLPNYNTHGKLITIENLLTHSSGVRSIYERSDYKKIKCNDFSKDEIVKLFENEPLFFEPGKDWNYSNSGFTLAALIIEKVTGLSFEEYLMKNIFKPIGMNHTYIASVNKLIAGMPPYYKLSGQSIYKPGPCFSWSLFFGSGDLISNVDDMLKWDEVLYSEKLIKEKWLSKAWTSYIIPNGQKTNYGYGWAVDEYKGLKVIQHDGIMGYLSDAIRIPEKHVYVIIISNNGGISPNAIADDIAFRLSGAPIVTGPARHLSNTKLREYEGIYEIFRPAGNEMLNQSKEKQFRYISVSGDTLFAQHSNYKKYKLTNIEDDLFLFEGTNTFIKFLRNKNGKVNKLDFFTEPINYGPNDIEVLTDIPLMDSSSKIINKSQTKN